MRPIIYPYNFGSKSARALSNLLRQRGYRAKRVRPDGNYRPYRNHMIINWGFQHVPEFLRNPVTGCGPVVNGFEAVGRASNKLLAFRAMEEAGDVAIPEFTTSTEEAQAWVDGGGIAVCRNILRGHSGAGIGLVGQSIIDGDHTGVVPRDVPMYVKYLKKATEYRIHVFNGRVIDIQQKRKRGGMEEGGVNYQIRNHQFGWVYCRGDVAPHQSVLDNAIASVRALGLDFGGVDVIWNDHYEQAHVLEVNTAVGLEGQTVINYANAIQQLL